jgi:hypothetical protein
VRFSAFQWNKGLEVVDRVFVKDIIWQKMVEVVITLDFEVCIINIKDPKIRDLKQCLCKGYDKPP